MNYRLIEPKRDEAPKEQIDWGYIALGSVALTILFLVIPLVRQWASAGWGL